MSSAVDWCIGEWFEIGGKQLQCTEAVKKFSDGSKRKLKADELKKLHRPASKEKQDKKQDGRDKPKAAMKERGKDEVRGKDAKEQGKEKTDKITVPALELSVYRKAQREVTAKGDLDLNVLLEAPTRYPAYRYSRPLIVAARLVQTENEDVREGLVTALIKAGVDPNRADSLGCTRHNYDVRLLVVASLCVSVGHHGY